jgi:hypothetical protein
MYAWEQVIKYNGHPLAERKSFLLRIDPDLLTAVQHWADDDLRSLNGQIEFLLRKALLDSGRLKNKDRPGSLPGENKSSK